MKLYANPTSPFVRIVRMAILEKGLSDRIEVEIVDAWADKPDFLDANPAGRVPALVTDDGARLTEAMLILQYLESVKPEPAVLPRGPGPGMADVLSRAGVAVNIFDASVAVIIGRKSAPDFDTNMVGTKRYRTMRDGFARLEATSPAPRARALDIADIAAITAYDYAVFRFPDIDWAAIAPKVKTLREANAGRPSVAETVPRG